MGYKEHHEKQYKERLKKVKQAEKMIWESYLVLVQPEVEFWVVRASGLKWTEGRFFGLRFSH